MLPVIILTILDRLSYIYNTRPLIELVKNLNESDILYIDLISSGAICSEWLVIKERKHEESLLSI